MYSFSTMTSELLHSAGPPSTATKFFMIAELLEPVLQDPPIQDLLRLQRVNQDFEAVIITSPKPRATFFYTTTLSIAPFSKIRIPQHFAHRARSYVNLFLDSQVSETEMYYTTMVTRHTSRMWSRARLSSKKPVPARTSLGRELRR